MTKGKLIIMKNIMAAIVMLVALCVQSAPMKTPWGEKVTAENAWRLYPRPQMQRDNWINLNGNWDYAVTKNAPSCPEKFDGKILVPFVIESSLSGVGRLLAPNETLWYRRSFDIDTKVTGKRIFLNFEQVDFRAMVFVNGREAGVPHEGGQMPFSYDITDLVKQGKNELVVSVWDPTTDFIGSTGKQSFVPRGCFYTRTSGIGGTVWIEEVPENHIASYRVTTDIDKGEVAFVFEAGSRIQYGQKGIVEIALSENKSIKKEFRFGEKLVVKLPRPVELWSPENPKLYNFTATLGQDVIKGYFGMRKIEVRKDDCGVLKIFFNNKPRFLIGTLDQGWWPDGLLTPPSEEAMAFDILKLKEMGYDMMRKHIKVEPRRYYYLCDKLGIILMQDMPSGRGNSEHRYGFYRREFKEMVDCLYNVPSIVCWIPYNEGWGQPGEFLTHTTLEWIRHYDPTRIVDGPSGWHDYEGGLAHGKTTKHKADGSVEAADLIDKHNYSKYPNMFPINSRRASFLGEFGGIGCRINGHMWTDKTWGYGGTDKVNDLVWSQNRFIDLMNHVAKLSHGGLAGCVYTQTTDVEAENNGLITYDRKVIKFNVAALREVHEKVRKYAEHASVSYKLKVLAPRLDPSPKAWAWTVTEPAEGWEKPTFNDSAWARSAGGFGNELIMRDYKKAKVSTLWNTNAIWLRRTFNYTQPKEKILGAVIKMFHDEDADVYLNGICVVKAKGHNVDWMPFYISPETFMTAIREGENTIAVKVVQKHGGQYFDLELALEHPKEK
jgi:hypothetical protein